MLLLAAMPALTFGEKGLSIKTVRHFSYPTFTRVVFEIEAAAPYVLTKSDDGTGLIFSAYEGMLSSAAEMPKINDGVIQSIELVRDETRPYVMIRLDAGAGDVKDLVLRNPDRIVLDVSRLQAAGGHRQTPAAATIVIDPGHGGGDRGIITGHGIEKSLALEISKGLEKLLRKHEPALRVVLTRDKDAALALDERAGIANRTDAAVFVSIHASVGKDIRVYATVLGYGDEAQQPAVPRDFLGFDAESDLRKAAWGSQQSPYLRESISLGRKIMSQIAGTPADPIQAPLALLAPVDAPAVMIEVGVQSDRGKALAAIAKGIEQYVKESR